MPERINRITIMHSKAPIAMLASEAASSANCPASSAGEMPQSPGTGVATRRASSAALGAPAPGSSKASGTHDSFGKKLDRRGVKYEVSDAGNYRITFKVGDTKRTQPIYFSSKTQSYDCLGIHEFFAPAANVSASVNGAKALELMAHSHTRKMGSWEIHGDMLMYTVKIPDAIDGEDLLSLMNLVVNTADEAEPKITGADAY